MKSGDFTHCTTLEQFYSEIRAFHELHHGLDYCKNHDALTKYANGSVMELGINQGASLAAIVLNPRVKQIHAVDLKLDYIEPYRHLFEIYCRDHGKDIEFIEADSTNPRTNRHVHTLHIDTDHKGDHLVKELIRHNFFVSNYIVLHDTNLTTMQNGLHTWLKEFTTSYEWIIKETDYKTYEDSVLKTYSAGYTVLERQN